MGHCYCKQPLISAWSLLTEEVLSLIAKFSDAYSFQAFLAIESSFPALQSAQRLREDGKGQDQYHFFRSLYASVGPQ